MPNFTSPFGERVFAQPQSSLLTIPNSTGTWNNSGAQYIRVTEDSLHMAPVEPKVPVNVKHGTASQLARVFGRKSGEWSLNIPIAPSGTAGTAPDMDPILQSVFGGAGAASVTGTPVGTPNYTYSIVDRASVPLTLLGFQHGVTATGNRFALGCIPQRFSIDFNQNLLSCSINGLSVSVVENETFSVIPDAVALGGLSAFPTEPGSFSANGGLVNAFGATFSVNGTPIVGQVDSFTFEFQTGQALKGNFIDSAYPMAVLYGVRTATVNLGLVNSDASTLATLKQLARQNTAVPITLALGTTAGYKVGLEVNGVQLVPASLQDQGGGYISCTFGSSSSSVQVGAANDARLSFA